MKHNRAPSFFATKFCLGKKGCCHDMRIMQFNFGGNYYKVCKSKETCSLKSDTPVKAKQQEIYVSLGGGK